MTTTGRCYEDDRAGHCSTHGAPWSQTQPYCTAVTAAVTTQK